MPRRNEVRPPFVAYYRDRRDSPARGRKEPVRKDAFGRAGRGSKQRGVSLAGVVTKGFPRRLQPVRGNRGQTLLSNGIPRETSHPRPKRREVQLSGGLRSNAEGDV